MAIIGYEGFCQRYDVKKATAYSLVSRKDIPHIRISGRMVRFDTDIVDAWFAARAVGDCRTESTETESTETESTETESTETEAACAEGKDK